jgi:hypothetical protein
VARLRTTGWCPGESHTLAAVRSIRTSATMFLALSFSGRMAGCLPVDEGSIPFGAANSVLVEGRVADRLTRNEERAGSSPVTSPRREPREHEWQCACPVSTEVSVRVRSVAPVRMLGVPEWFRELAVNQLTRVRIPSLNPSCAGEPGRPGGLQNRPRRFESVHRCHGRAPNAGGDYIWLMSPRVLSARSLTDAGVA